jgi:hypothetical protein
MLYFMVTGKKPAVIDILLHENTDASQRAALGIL